MITIYCGKSSAGKDYLFKKALKEKRAKPIVGITSRPMREGEIQGKDYIFVSREKLLSMAESGEIFEYRSYQTMVNNKPETWYYGSPEVDPRNDYVTVLDLNGVFTYVSHYGPENVTVNYVYADYEVRLKRAKKRGSFSQEVWDARVEDDKKYTKEKLEELETILGQNFVWMENNKEESV